jgi:hypothetical protein
MIQHRVPDEVLDAIARLLVADLARHPVEDEPAPADDDTRGGEVTKRRSPPPARDAWLAGGAKVQARPTTQKGDQR